METEEYKGFTIEIEQDTDVEDPREGGGSLTTMVCFHKRYSLGDKHNYKFDNYNSWQELKEAIIKEHKPVIIKTLNMYDHSGITISTGNAYPFNDMWDAGQIGFVFISRKDALENWSKKRITPKIKKDCERILDAEVKLYDDYVTGSVYRYVIKDSDDERIDSCGGYYGYDNEKSGLLEAARERIDEEIENIKDANNIVHV